MLAEAIGAHVRPWRRREADHWRLDIAELRELGVDQFAIYLQHDAKESTLQAYGEHVIPVLAEHALAKQ